MHKDNFDLPEIVYYAFVAFFIFLFFYLANYAIQQHFENQDRMLCHSAQKSGNSEWLEKCQCYYEGLPVTCINNKERTAL